ncbi:imelysin family protein [Halopseudomonas sp.]|uniref:imelysin family protein n=1 Tax=Halopseudomonas sp. TaxID=2901191 RepID=UPI003563E718
MVNLCALLVAALSPLALAQPAKAQWHADLGKGYQQLAASTKALQQRALAYCEAPDQHDVATVRSAWQRAFMDWQKVRFVDFGPIEQDNIACQMQFWPDSKNLVALKTDNWLKSDQPIDTAAIAADSVAAKGFPALEYLLFDPRVTEDEHALPARRSCEFMQAVSAQIHTNANRLQRDWSSFETHFLSRPEYARTTVSAAMHTLEILRDKRLAAPMGLGGKARRNPYVADAWRSGESLASIEATLAGFMPRKIITSTVMAFSARMASCCTLPPITIPVAKAGYWCTTRSTNIS